MWDGVVIIVVGACEGGWKGLLLVDGWMWRSAVGVEMGGVMNGVVELVSDRTWAWLKLCVCAGNGSPRTVGALSPHASYSMDISPVP